MGKKTQEPGEGKGSRFSYVQDWNQELKNRGWWHSFELPDGRTIEGVCTLQGLKNRLAQFPIPSDLRGKRVLDIGAWDGWFTFEMERRGADVVAVDVWDNPKFRQMHEWLGSRADYRILDVYELTPERLGTFDIVLFFGVLYHLKHPLLALEKVCALTTGLGAVDSFVLKEEYLPGGRVDDRPVMEFYETTEMGGQTDNWVGPSVPCLIAMCRTAGFARVNFLSRLEHSACLACYREWEPLGANASAAPEAGDVFHHTNFGFNFYSGRDEYLAILFRTDQADVSINTVKPTVGQFGVRPINVKNLEGGWWQANFMLPPGLRPGWHDVRVRVGDSLPSEPRRIALDVDPSCSELTITGAADGATWKPDEIDLTAGGTLSIWIRGLPENADLNNLIVMATGRPAQITYVEPWGSAEPRQVNVQMPEGLAAGIAEIQARIGDVESPSATIQIVRG